MLVCETYLHIACVSSFFEAAVRPRVFVVRAGLNPPRRHEESRRVFDQVQFRLMPESFKSPVL